MSEQFTPQDPDPRYVRNVRPIRAKAEDEAPKEEAKPIEELVPEVDLTGFADAYIPPARFAINPIFPIGEVTLFAGHGGGGKTIVTLLLACGVACGRNVAPMCKAAPGRAAFISYEDPKERMLRRLRALSLQHDLPPQQLEQGLSLYDATEAPPIAFEAYVDGQRTLEFGPVLDFIDRVAQTNELLVIDNASDSYDGNENERRQVRKFVGALRRIARRHGCAVVLLAHIDKNAARLGANGNTYSGSTAWHNSTRSRLAMVNNEIEQEKLNEGKPLDGKILVVWTEDGVPSLVGETDAPPVEDDEAILEVLEKAQGQGVTLYCATVGAYTTHAAVRHLPGMPEKYKDAKRGKSRFDEVLGRLAESGKLVRRVERTGQRRDREVWACAKVRTNCAQ